MSNEIGAIIKSSQQRKAQDQTFKELGLMHLQLFHKIEMEKILLNSYYEASINLIPKTKKF
jgi:hypothetical protein